MNDKAYNKSVEQGELWTLHPETGRLVPFEGGGTLLDITEESAWFSATLSVAPGTGSAAPEAGAAESEASGGVDAADIGSTGEIGSDPSELRLTGSILHQLQTLIDDRRETLPEGSYTTHLFSKGSEKIRKKTGEEAIELILAVSKEEMIYEAADLVYHLLVLLSAEELSIDEVLAELARRHG